MAAAMRTGWLVAVVVVLVACGGNVGEDDGRINVVATTSIMADIVDHVAAEDADVEVLIPNGTDPHEFSLSARQAALIEGADLVVAVGLGLEEGLVDALEAATASGVEVIEMAELVDPLPLRGGDAPDPHFWMDPTRVAHATEVIGTALDRIEPAAAWTVRADGYGAELRALDDELSSLLEAIPPERRTLVTNHEALGYFAARYGFTIAGVVMPGGSTLAEPSSAELARLVSEMQSAGVDVIFAETTAPTALAAAVAAEVGEEVQVVELHTEAFGPPGSGAEDLIGLLRTNAELIAEAMR